MFNLFFKKQSEHNEDEVLNFGLGVAITHYLRPIQEQLKTEFPVLTAAEQNHYNKVCQSVVKFGEKAIWRLFRKKGPDMKLEDLKPIMVRRYTWVSDKNVLSLITIGVYHIMK